MDKERKYTNSDTHWNKVYAKKEIESLGWYEENPAKTLELIEKCKLDNKAAILNVGAGATTLIDCLLDLGYSNLIANDLSEVGLQKLQERLGKDKSENVQWIVDDLTKSTKLDNLGEVDLWIDRAVLHFLNEDTEQQTYFDLLRKLVKKNGYVIIAAFNLQGAEKCSGLPVFRYNKDMILERLGNQFTLIDSFEYVYTMPSGDTRDYIYTLFRRV